jgi:hypothetical protein
LFRGYVHHPNETRPSSRCRLFEQVPLVSCKSGASPSKRRATGVETGCVLGLRIGRSPPADGFSPPRARAVVWRSIVSRESLQGESPQAPRPIIVYEAAHQPTSENHGETREDDQAFVLLKSLGKTLTYALVVDELFVRTIASHQYTKKASRVQTPALQRCLAAAANLGPCEKPPLAPNALSRKGNQVAVPL